MANQSATAHVAQLAKGQGKTSLSILFHLNLKYTDPIQLSGSQHHRDYHPIKREWADTTAYIGRAIDRDMDPISRYRQEGEREGPWNAVQGIYTGPRDATSTISKGSTVASKDSMGLSSMAATKGSESKK